MIGRGANVALPAALVTAALAGAGGAVLWGFTVDDALISARVAHHVALGAGHRFNLDGPAVDAVTPLGWAYLLAPFARTGPLAGLDAARVLGLVVWMAAAGWMGAWAAAAGERWQRFAPLALVAVAAPLGAWAVAGMETGVVTALATLALARHPASMLAAGVAAAWRPELIPWAATLSVGRAWVSWRAGDPRRLGVAIGVAAALVPPLAVATTRAVAFGSAAPLAVWAKPSDLDHGATYALAALIFTGPAWLVVAPRGIRVLRPVSRVTLAAALVHFVAVAFAGGDWMPLSRLVVPVLPGLILLGVEIAEAAPGWATGARLALACGAALWPAITTVPDARRVFERRAALVREAAPALVGARRVAALDVGWVGAATPAAVVDLAGVTDIDVARQPGGHTSKKLPPGFLERRDVDALVLLASSSAPGGPGAFNRAVEQRVAAMAGLGGADARYRLVASIPLGGTSKWYGVYRRTGADE